MTTDTQISRAAQRLIDAEYSLGDDKLGFNCATMLLEFYGNLGIELPQEFNGFNRENYAERWKNGEGREEFYDYLMGLGEEVQLNYERAGDIVVFDGKDWVYPGIYLGSGHILCAFERGCRVVPYKFLRNTAIACRRLIKT